jgi:hypothetical protein
MFSSIVADKVVEKIGFFHSITPPPNSLSSFIDPILALIPRSPWMTDIFSDSLYNQFLMGLQGHPIRTTLDPAVSLYLKFLLKAQSIFAGIGTVISSLHLRLNSLLVIKGSRSQITQKDLFDRILIEFDGLCRLLKVKNFYSYDTSEFHTSLDEACKGAFYYVKSPLMEFEDHFLKLPRVLTKNTLRLKLHRYASPMIQSEFHRIRNSKYSGDSLLKSFQKSKKYRNHGEGAFQRLLFQIEMFRILFEFSHDLLVDVLNWCQANKPMIAAEELQGSYFFMINSILDILFMMRFDLNHLKMQGNIEVIIKNVQSSMVETPLQKNVIRGFQVLTILLENM